MQLRFVVPAAAVLLFSLTARADSKSAEDACLAAHKKTQELELDKKLVEAEEQAVSCSQAACPEQVREMCVDFLGRIRSSKPTAVLVVRGTSGKTYSDAKVSIDGQPLAGKLDGVAMGMDPGSHAIDFEVDGLPKGSLSVTVREGEKDREIALEVEDGGTRPKFSPWAHLFGGLGVASLAAFAAVGSVALVRAGNLDDECGHRCSKEKPDDVDSVVRMATAADVCLGAGLTLVAAAGLTMGLTWRPSRPQAAATAPRATFAASPRGLTFDLRF